MVSETAWIILKKVNEINNITFYNFDLAAKRPYCEINNLETEGDGRGGGEGGVLMIDVSTNLRSFIIIV